MIQETDTRFVAPGTLVQPGTKGRVLRMVAGVVGLSGTLVALLQPRLIIELHTIRLADAGLWTWLGLIYLAFHLYVHVNAFPYIINIGYGKDWRYRPFFVAVGLAGLAAVADRVLFGGWWSPLLGWYVFAFLVYSTAHLGIAHVLAAILGTPGCEMRSIPQLFGSLTGQEVEEHFCPGSWTKFDEREAQRRGEVTP